MSTDPAFDRELAIVAALRHAGATVTGPNAFERDRMRQRIMAEFPAVARDNARRSIASHRAPGRWRVIPEEARGRLLVAAAAALCLFMSLSGMSVLLARDALPGDALYTFKRSAESTQLGLTFGDEPKAFTHLEFANARVSEIEALADQADTAGTWSANQDRLLQALDDFELDTTAGARLLTTVATEGQSNVLTPLRGWVEQQETRLESIRGALPLPASTRLDSTFELLDRVMARVTALDERADCSTISSGSHDDLGWLPARGRCEPAVPNGVPPTVLPPQDDALPGTNPADGPVPGLLVPPSGAPAPDSGEIDDLGLSSTLGDVLGTPSKPDTESNPLSPEDGSQPSIPPLPVPWIPPISTPELEDPHVE
ncbi:MAG: DUF5667 domain-containing protein [Pseudonocardiaceae bacterium]